MNKYKNDMIEKLHTTCLGEQRIKRNLALETIDVVQWSKEKILMCDEKNIVRKGKNWYITVDNCVLTINAHSYTIITAHTIRGRKHE